MRRVRPRSAGRSVASPTELDEDDDQDGSESNSRGAGVDMLGIGQYDDALVAHQMMQKSAPKRTDYRTDPTTGPTLMSMGTMNQYVTRGHDMAAHGSMAAASASGALDRSSDSQLAALETHFADEAKLARQTQKSAARRPHRRRRHRGGPTLTSERETDDEPSDSVIDTDDEDDDEAEKSKPNLGRRDVVGALTNVYATLVANGHMTNAQAIHEAIKRCHRVAEHDWNAQ